MKVKNLEKEIERKFKSSLREFSKLLDLYEAYEEKASKKRKKKFSDKMGKKFGKEAEMLTGRIDNMD